MEKIRFDIAAKYPPDTKSDDRPLMLRTLLEDRFKLAVHHETKDMPGYGAGGGQGRPQTQTRGPEADHPAPAATVGACRP